MTRFLRLAACVIMMMTAGVLQAASIAECLQIEDDAKRLACFDAAARGPAMTSPSPPVPAPAPPTPAPVPLPADATADAAPAASAPATQQPPTPVPVPTSPVVVTGTQAAGRSAETVPAAAPAAQTGVIDPHSDQYDDLFGLENELINKGTQEIQSRIINEFVGWDEDTVFELENGQVWIQSDNNTTFVYRGEPSPVATVKKGYFGSYRLKVDGFNKNVRVKRVK